MSINAQTLLVSAKKYPVLITCGVFSLGLSVTLFLRPGIVDQLEGELDAVAKEVKRYSTNINYGVQLQEQYDFLIQANTAVKERTLPVDSIAINLQYFYRLESEVGVKYLDLRPIARPTAPSAKSASKGKALAGKSTAYVPLDYIVTIQGTYEQVLTYLRHIENGAYFARVNTAAISGSADSVTANLNLSLLGSP
jgi:hypothetical protein